MKRFSRWIHAFGLALLLAAASSFSFAEDDDPGLPVPPRIGLVSGQASFWRPGADDWAPAQVNMPLAAGDAVYTADGAALELQIGARAYARLAQNAMLTLLDDDRDVQQFKVTSGIVAFDLRGLAGRSIEIDTPDGAFIIEKAGYYRVEIADDTTHFTTRRGGEAIVTLADGGTRRIASGMEAIVAAGDDVRDIETYTAPDADNWDEWNLARSDDLLDAVSSRYVPQDVYGADDLDRYGDWRTTSEYGAVWVPSGVGPDWAPYSSGSWVWDPVYSWTWVDASPWGWAPYHYGRWVHVSGYWGWAPGPRHVRAVYAPALVAFFHSGSTSISISSGPAVSWVALGWGEPCVPWWGRSGFAGRPWWGGWGGPRVVNNVVIQNNTVINNINIDRRSYRNLQQRNALIAVPERSFGHGRLANERRYTGMRDKDFAPIGARHPVRPAAASFAPTTARSVAPTRNVLDRSAVAVREPRQRDTPWRAERGNDARGRHQVPGNAPDNRIVRARPSSEQRPPAAGFASDAQQQRRPSSSRQLQAPAQIGRPAESESPRTAEQVPQVRQRQLEDDTRREWQRRQSQQNGNDNGRRLERDERPRPPPAWRNEGRNDVREEVPARDMRRSLGRADERPAMPGAVAPRQQQPMRIEPVPQRPPAWQREAPQMPAPVAPRRPEAPQMPAPVAPRQAEPPWRNPAANQGAMSVAPQRPPQQEMRREFRRQEAQPAQRDHQMQMQRGQGNNRQEFGR